MFQYILAIPIPLAIYHYKSSKTDKIDLSKAFAKPKMSSEWNFRWIFISMSTVYIASMTSKALFNCIQSLTGITLQSIDLSIDDAITTIIGNSVVTLFLAPFIEEVFFRGILLTNVSKFGAKPMIIVLGIIFGLWHGNYEQCLYTAVLGIFAGFLTLKNESIIPAIILHFFINFLGTLLSISIGTFNDTQTQNRGCLSYNYYYVIITLIVELMMILIVIIGIIFAVIELIKNKDSFILKDCKHELPSMKIAKAYIMTPSTTVLIIILLGVIIINAL